MTLRRDILKPTEGFSFKIPDLFDLNILDTKGFNKRGEDTLFHVSTNFEERFGTGSDSIVSHIQISLSRKLCGGGTCVSFVLTKMKGCMQGFVSPIRSPH